MPSAYEDFITTDISTSRSWAISFRAGAFAMRISTAGARAGSGIIVGNNRCEIAARKFPTIACRIMCRSICGARSNIRVIVW